MVSYIGGGYKLKGRQGAPSQSQQFFSGAHHSYGASEVQATREKVVGLVYLPLVLWPPTAMLASSY